MSALFRRFGLARRAQGKRVRFVEVKAATSVERHRVEIDLVGRCTIRFASNESVERSGDVVSELSERMGC